MKKLTCYIYREVYLDIQTEVNLWNKIPRKIYKMNDCYNVVIYNGFN